MIIVRLYATILDISFDSIHIRRILEIQLYY